MQVGGNELIGELLERRYRVDAPIARGGMSTVYRGLDVRLDRPVAIKVMEPKFAADPQFLSRFEFEARAVAKLKHPGLVAVYDQGLDGEHAFLVMELVEGGTLRELLRERGPMPPHAVRGVAEPVLDALGVAHAAGLVHRDVKPENVLISDSGEVKIADFGLVRAVAAATTTSSSVILGTAAYLSPEQVATGSSDARSDVYSMGILVFEMLTGRAPFTGDSSLAIAYQRLNHDVPSPSRFIAGVPAEFDDLVAEATAREPAHRFADARAMATSLRAVAAQLHLPAYRVPAPQRSAEHLSAQYRRPQEPTTQRAPEKTALPPTRAGTATVAPPPPQRQHVQQHTKIVTAPTDRRSSAAVAPAPQPPKGGGYRYPDFVEDRGRSRRTIVVWLVIIVLLALLVGIGGWWMGSGRYTAVPSIDGLDRAGATSAIEQAGLTSEIRGRHSDTIPVDTVIGTDPAAGSRVPKNSLVALLVSLGQPSVPDVEPGEDLAAVREKIRTASLQPVEGGEKFSAQAPLGTVAAIDPPPGTVVAVGSTVKVVRSKGSPPVQLPDLQGDSVDDATAALAKLGISVKDTREEFDESVDGGQVVGTDPAQGSTLDAGSEVTLIVSNAIKVPLLLGQTVGDSRGRLEELGLTVQVRQLAGGDSSRVIGQNPGAGVRVERGRKVTLNAFP